MTNSLIQALAEAETNADVGGNEVDYVRWATEKFRNEDGSLNVEALARGKYESDVRFIPQLQQEKQGVLDELKTRESLQSFMQKWEQQRQGSTNSPVTTPSESPNNSNSSNTNPVDIQSILAQVDNHIVNRQREQIAQANVKQVRDALVSKWGAQSVTKLQAKAQELGVSTDFLFGVAQSSPKAFLELVLDKAPASPPVAPNSYVPPRNQSISQPVINTGGAHKTKKQWDNLRKTMNPVKYWSKETQMQYYADAAALGDKFDE